MKTRNLIPPPMSRDGPPKSGLQVWMIFVALCVGGLVAVPLYAQSHGGHGGGHGGGGGGHVGGGHVGGGHAEGGHIGGGHPGYSHVTVSPGGFHQGGFSHPSVGHPSAGHLVTSPSSFAHGPNTFTTHAPSAAHSTFGGAGHHFDASHWTGGHASVPHSSGGFATSGGHSAWTPAGTHTAGTLHSTFGDAGHHFDASHWTSGHLGDAHHFSPVHHDDHHVTYGHHDFHHAHFGGLGLGFGWWSYPSYYDYPYYYLASYYEEPVNPSTASPYGTSAVPASYVTAQVGDTGTATETRVPGVVIPRMELPSREAPEALPEERPAGAPGKVPPGNPPPHKHSEEGGK